MQARNNLNVSQKQRQQLLFRWLTCIKHVLFFRSEKRCSTVIGSTYLNISQHDKDFQILDAWSRSAAWRHGSSDRLDASLYDKAGDSTGRHEFSWTKTTLQPFANYEKIKTKLTELNSMRHNYTINLRHVHLTDSSVKDLQLRHLQPKMAGQSQSSKGKPRQLQAWFLSAEKAHSLHVEHVDGFPEHLVQQETELECTWFLSHLFATSTNILSVNSLISTGWNGRRRNARTVWPVRYSKFVPKRCNIDFAAPVWFTPTGLFCQTAV